MLMSLKVQVQDHIIMKAPILHNYHLVHFHQPTLELIPINLNQALTLDNMFQLEMVNINMLPGQMGQMLPTMSM